MTGDLHRALLILCGVPAPLPLHVAVAYGAAGQAGALRAAWETCDDVFLMHAVAGWKSPEYASALRRYRAVFRVWEKARRSCGMPYGSFGTPAVQRLEKARHRTLAALDAAGQAERARILAAVPTVTLAMVMGKDAQGDD